MTGTESTAASRVISFDLDGTLINGPFGTVIKDVDQELELRQGISGTKAAVLGRHAQLLGTDPLAAYDWETIVGEHVESHGASVPFDLLERLDVYASRGATRILHEGTAAHLEALRSAGWRVLVLTNGWRRYQEPVLRHCGLLAVIDELVASDDVGHAKPDPAIFAAARGGAVEHVHVGDRIDHDVIGGRAANAVTVLLRRDVPDDPAAWPDYLDGLARSEGAPASPAPDLITARFDDLHAWLAGRR